MEQSPRTSALEALLGSLAAAVARALALDLPRLSRGQRLLLHISLLACLLNLCASVFDFFHFGGTDLRSRVVGARAILHGRDPYTLTNAPDLPPALQDPYQVYAGLSRCSYPPSLLLAYAPLSPLPYPVQRGLWMVLEWLALGTMLGLLARLLRGQSARYLFVVTMLALVAASYFWRLHVERGQYYVFLGLLLALGLRLAMQHGDHAGAGICLGIVAALRPTALVLFVPLGIAGARKTVLAGVLAAAGGIALTLPFVGLAGWRSFAWMSTEWDRGVMEKGYLEKTYPRLAQPPEPVDGFDPATLPSLSGNLAFSRVFGGLAKDLPGLGAADGPLLSRAVFLAVLALATVLLLLAQRRRRFTMRRALTASILLLLGTDYFLPVRIGYVDVLLCIPIALMMPLLARPSYRPFFLLMVTAFLLSVVPIAGLLSEGYWKMASVTRSLIVLYVCGRALLVGLEIAPQAVRRHLAPAKAPVANESRSHALG